MFNQDEGKIECAVGNREISFLAGQESRDFFDFISDVGIRGIYLSLALCTAKFKQLCRLTIFFHFYIISIFKGLLDHNHNH